MTSIGERPVTGPGGSVAEPADIQKVGGVAVDPAAAAVGALSELDKTLAVTDLTPVALNISTATTTTVVTAGAGAVTTRVHRMRMFVAGANTVTINGATPEVVPFSSPGSLTYDFNSRPWFTTAAATAFTITTSTTAAVTGTVEYIKN